MRNLIASHDEIDNFIIRSINPTTIEYYYPDENPSSWTPEEYQEKYQTLTATLRRDLKYRAKAEGFSKEIHQIIQQDFPLENISISSIFRSRPTDSQEWSNIGVGVTKINQNGEKEYAKTCYQNRSMIFGHILSHKYLHYLDKNKTLMLYYSNQRKMLLNINSSLLSN